MIYLDNNATTQLTPEVEATYQDTLKKFGNPSSLHREGREAKRLLNESRERVAEILKISDSTIVFTSGGTESINAALYGSFLPRNNKNHLILSKVEHPAVLKSARFLIEFGIDVTFVGVDEEGAIDPAQIEAAIRPETAMIAVMFANNETGNLYPVKVIGEIARSKKITFLCDAAQAVGKVPIDLSRLPIDILTGSAHKFHGPKGVGFLYLHPGIDWEPLIRGGRQEWGRRAGTENIPGIVAMAEALALADREMLRNTKKISGLRDRLQAGILQRVPGTVLHGDLEHRLPNTLNLRVEEISAETVLMNLDLEGIAASGGSACESGSMDPSHVLLSMGLKYQEAMGGLRFSLSRYNTDVEIDEVLRVFPEVISKIRSSN